MVYYTYIAPGVGDTRNVTHLSGGKNIIVLLLENIKKAAFSDILAAFLFGQRKTPWWRAETKGYCEWCLCGVFMSGWCDCWPSACIITGITCYALLHNSYVVNSTMIMSIPPSTLRVGQIVSGGIFRLL